jgi:hypothetical protein
VKGFQTLNGTIFIADDFDWRTLGEKYYKAVFGKELST